MQQYAGWEILGSMMISQMPKYLYLVGEMFPSHTNTESKVAQSASLLIKHMARYGPTKTPNDQANATLSSICL